MLRFLYVRVSGCELHKFCRIDVCFPSILHRVKVQRKVYVPAKPLTMVRSYIPAGWHSAITCISCISHVTVSRLNMVEPKNLIYYYRLSLQYKLAAIARERACYFSYHLATYNLQQQPVSQIWLVLYLFIYIYLLFLIGRPASIPHPDAGLVFFHNSLTMCVVKWTRIRR